MQGFDVATVYFVFGPLWAFPSTTVWAFDVTEVIVDYSLLSASIFIAASHGTPRREREGERRRERESEQRLPFISTLIFLCDGWLSYCVICAFWKMLLGAEEINQLPNHTIKHSAPEKGTQRTIKKWSKLQKWCHWSGGFKHAFVAVNDEYNQSVKIINNFRAAVGQYILKT